MGVALPGFGTLAVGALCMSLQFAGMVFAGPGFLRAVMLDPGAVWLRGEAWRLFTSALFHAGLFHLAINMISHVSLGGELERRLGTLKFLAVTLLIMLCSSVMYIVICLALSQLGSRTFWFNYTSVGFSGVLFGYAAIESLLPTASPTRSVFGLFEVPTKWYPWLLMLILQILLPNVSLLGHLAGLLCGTVYSVGGCAYFVPSRDRTVRVDAMLSERMPNYCKIPESSGVDEYARIGIDMLAVRRVCSSIGGGALASRSSTGDRAATSSGSKSVHHWPESGGHVLGGVTTDETAVAVNILGGEEEQSSGEEDTAPLLDDS